MPWGRSLPEICLTQELANVLQDTSRGSEACGLRWGVVTYGVARLETSFAICHDVWSA